MIYANVDENIVKSVLIYASINVNSVKILMFNINICIISVKIFIIDVNIDANSVNGRARFKKHKQMFEYNSYLETSGGQSFNPYLNVVHFFNTTVD
jgi:hypothetical protein